MKVLHETIIKDIKDIFDDVKSSATVKELLNKAKTRSGRSNIRSIAQMSSNVTLTYPCLVSNSLSIDSASMISKANERKNAQMIQLLLGCFQQQKLNGDEEFDPIKYLQQFHKNMNISYNFDDILATVDDIVKLAESTGIEDMRSTFSINESRMIQYLQENQTPDNTLPDMFSESSVASYKVSKNNRYGKTVVVQERSNWSDGYPHNQDVGLYGNGVFDPTAPDAPDQDDMNVQRFHNAYNGEIRDQNAELRAQNRENREAKRFEWEEKDRIRRNNYEHNEELRKQAKFDSDMRMNNIKSMNTAQQTAQGRIAQLQNVDVKKANELVGTPIMVTVHIVNDNGLLDPVSFLIAIKSKIYPLDSKDIIQRIINKNKDRNFFGKIIKVATGEISFARDFLFAVDKAKLDSLSQSRKGNSSKMWRVLERMAAKSKFSRAIGKQNEYMAITTLVMSQEEVEYIKKYANMNIENEAIARGIIDAYNLLCLVIVDETNETAKFLYNADQDLFEELSFNQLEREATDGSYRKMVNLITKMK